MKKKILVIDQDKGITALMEYIFSKKYNIYIATNIRESFEIIKHFKPDLILCDKITVGNNFKELESIFNIKIIYMKAGKNNFIEIKKKSKNYYAKKEDKIIINMRNNKQPIETIQKILESLGFKRTLNSLNYRIYRILFNKTFKEIKHKEEILFKPFKRKELEEYVDSALVFNSSEIC